MFGKGGNTTIVVMLISGFSLHDDLLEICQTTDLKGFLL